MVSVNLSDELVAQAKQYGAAMSRSTPKQIEHWAKIGQIAEDNPDLPYEFIRDILLAMEDPTPPTPFEFTEIDDPRDA